MEKRDHLKRSVKDDFRSSRASSSEPASNTSGTILEPRLHGQSSATGQAAPTETRSQDASAKGLWGLALDGLSEEDKKTVLQIKSESMLDILRHLHTEAVKKQTYCEDRIWKFELNGRQIILRDVAGRIISWIDKFKEIGDIAVNFDPVHASLPWAGIRLLLQMTVAESQQMGALLTGVEKISSLISRCQVYEALYRNRDQSGNEDWKLATMNLTSALMTLYATMLSFLACAIRVYGQSAPGRVFTAIPNPVKIINFLEKIQTLESNVATEVDNCDRIHSRQVKASSEEQTQMLKEILASLETPILRVDSRVAGLCAKLKSSERLSILEWISGIPYEENHYFARHGRTRGTGEWLLRHDRYREWCTSSASMILWLHGDPGAGKTKLISTVVDDLLKRFKQSRNDEALAYFYCDRNQSDRRDPELILSSFVRQLSARNNDEIPLATKKMYKQKKQTCFPSGKLKLGESLTILAQLLQVYPQITLVVDALDECDIKTRSGLIEVLDKLIAESSRPLKILISSRRDTDIKHHFGTGPNLEITATDNRDDIATFVSHEIIACENLRQKEFSVELKDLICKTLVDKSKGVFQWVALQIAVLHDLCRELCREQVIRNRLGKLPKTLEATYDDLYLKIQSQEDDTVTIANRSFRWIMCSCWPLSQAELIAAVCQDPDTDEVNETDIDINVILRACQNLLVVNEELDECRFSHLNCVSIIAISSFSITSNQETALPNKKDEDEDARSILSYACFNWVTHIQRLEGEEIIANRLTALLKDFLGSMDRSSLAYQNWYEMVGMYLEFGYRYRRKKAKGRLTASKTRLTNRLRQKFDSTPVAPVYDQLSPCSQASLAIVTFGFHKTIYDWWRIGFADINQKNSCDNSLLMLGARTGVSGVVSITENLLKMGADVNVVGGLYGSALQAASESGSESVVQLLLNKGADVNVTGGRFGSALQAASKSGSESVVQLLLDKGADVNASSGGLFGSALQAASNTGVKSVVQLLLDKGADVNVAGGLYGSALQAASESGSESVVQLLLNKGADVNVTGGRFGSALQAASYSGSESVVQLLLDKGADVNVSSVQYSSALQAAPESGSESVVQLLLDKGADVDASGGLFGSALQVASFSGYESIVRLLLDKGADVNGAGAPYGSALQAASESGSESVVQLLLNKGADVNVTGGIRFGSALQAASKSDSESVVQLLLDKGADVDASGGLFGSALQAASNSGVKSVVQLLLDKGADVHVAGGLYGSALQAASFSGSESVVQLLLDKGADVNVSSGQYGSALQAASYSGHESVVQLLLNKGADVNVAGGDYGSALQAASFSGDVSVVRLLLENGADINVGGGHYDSALQAASFSGVESVVRLLLENGADVHVAGGLYGSALQAASYSGSESVVQLLLDKGADVNVSSGQYGSALQAASFSGYESVVQLLIDNGADVNLAGGEFRSALHAASDFGHESVVELLLDNGADVNVSNEDNHTALDIARLIGHQAMVQLLEAAVESR